MAYFAHISDVHLGAFPRDEALAKENLKAFYQAMDICMERKVDFILFSGDLFHTTKPDLNLVGEAVEKMRQVKESGIDIFLLYGSHDFSTLATSIADILEYTGFLNTIKIKEQGSKFLPVVETHPATGVNIAGIVGHNKGMEIHYYRKYEKRQLESIKGLKVFVFHSALEDLFESNNDIKGIPIKYLPKNMNYYAGGHLHKRLETNLQGYGWIVYPGTLFGATFSDLEETAKEDLDRGFYLVRIGEGKPLEKEFVTLNVPEIIYKNFECDGKTPDEVESDISNFIDQNQIKEKVVLVRLKGRLQNAKKYHIDFDGIRSEFMRKGALCVKVNSNALKSCDAKEEYDVEGMKNLDLNHEKTIAEGLKELSSKSAAEMNLFSEKEWYDVALGLFKTTTKKRKDGESKKDYTTRISKEALKVLEEKGVF